MRSQASRSGPKSKSLAGRRPGRDSAADRPERNEKDEQLVERSLGGDRPAFERLVRRHRRSLVNHLFRQVGREDHAADSEEAEALEARIQDVVGTWAREMEALGLSRDAIESIARLPALRGVYLRQAFYARTLSACGKDCYFGWMSVFSMTEARVMRLRVAQ